MSKDETTEAIMELLEGDPWGQATRHAQALHAGDPADHHPEDCRACEAGEGMRHNYEPPQDDDTLGPCGCVDYHMSDCPTRTGGNGMTSDDYLRAWERGGYRDDYYDQP